VVPTISTYTMDMQIVCAKVREGERRIVRIKEGDPRGRHVVIVDDLVQSGGTLIECQVYKSVYADSYMALKLESYIVRIIVANMLLYIP